MAATRILIDFKSSEVGTLMWVPLPSQRSSVQPQATIAFSESISFAPKVSFSIGFAKFGNRDGLLFFMIHVFTSTMY